MKAEHTKFLLGEMHKKATPLTGKEKAKIWKLFGEKFGEDVTVNMLEVPLGLLPGLIGCW